MALLNHAKRELNAKIVYYGPGLCGKTTNIQFIHQKLRPESRGKLLSLATETDRTLFFDFLPVELGEIKGFKTRFHLYTVPGQVFYDSTRQMVLKGADGVVFVADSQRDMVDANLESLGNLRDNLVIQGRRLEDVPLVIQCNKRDLPDVLSMEEMGRLLNPRHVPIFPASALSGTGVVQTLTSISKMVLHHLKQPLAQSGQGVATEKALGASYRASRKTDDRLGSGAPDKVAPAPPQLPALTIAGFGTPRNSLNSHLYLPVQLLLHGRLETFNLHLRVELESDTPRVRVEGFERENL